MKEIISRDGPSLDQLLDEAYLTQMQMKDLPKIIYKYTNGKVVTGFSDLGEDFFKWLPGSGVSARKQQKILEHVKTNKKGWEGMWTIMKGLIAVKDDIIQQFDNL